MTNVACFIFIFIYIYFFGEFVAYEKCTSCEIQDAVYVPATTERHRPYAFLNAW